MEKEHVTIQQAKVLNKYGFNSFGNAYYELPGGKFIETKNLIHCNMNLRPHGISAPTLSKAAAWLRDRYGFHIEVSCRKAGEYEPIGCITPSLLDGIVYIFDLWDPYHGIMFKTYEDALSAGISEALKYISKTLTNDPTTVYLKDQYALKD